MALPTVASNLGEMGLGSVNLGDNTPVGARVTQVVKEVAGAPSDAKARVTQVVKEVPGSPASASVKARVTQVVKEVAALVNNSNIGPGTAPIPSSAAVVTGGTVALTPPAIQIVGTTVVASGGVVTGGTVTQGIPITGTVVVASGGVVTGGAMTIGLWLTGAAPVLSGGVVTGGAVEYGLVLAGSAPVVSGGVVSGGVVTQGIPIIGSAPVVSGGVVPGGLVRCGVWLTGTATIPSGAFVYTPGMILGPVEQLLPGAYGPLGQMPVPRANRFDRLLLAETARLAQAYRDMARTGAGPGGLSGLGEDARRELMSVYQDVSRYPYSEGDLDGGYLAHGQRKDFFERGVVLTPATASGDVVVVQFQVPVGYFGLLLGYYCEYTGTGFVQGSGDIIWRLRFGTGWVRNMGSLPYAVGSLANPFPLESAVVLATGQRVQFIVNVPNTSGNIQVGTSRILCGLQGWFYPQPVHVGLGGNRGS